MNDIESCEYSFEDDFPILVWLGSKAQVRNWKEQRERFRNFAKRCIAPFALEFDYKITLEPNYLASDFCKKACEERLFSFLIPRFFGGEGGDTISCCIMLEEFCASCAGLGNIIGAHYLGMTALMVGLNMELMGRICDEIVNGEKRGEAVVLSAAHTEPGSGSDIEDEFMIRKSRITTTAKKVEGGYLINGRKVFISNGHLARYHFVSAWKDRNDPINSGIGVIVPSGSAGFTLGKSELKMGQKSCPASELIFEDCFVPQKNVAIDTETTFRRVLYVLGSSRAGVSAIGTGIARGAYERALQWAKEKSYKGTPLIENQSVKFILTRMFRNVHLGRLLYINSSLVDMQDGLTSLLVGPSAKMVNILPSSVLRSFISQRIIRSKITSKLFNKMLDGIGLERRQRAQAMSSMAKWTATDLAMENALLLMELVDGFGLGQEEGMEKIYRDAKLVQIYEGTNEINLLHSFDNLIARTTRC